MTEVFTLILIGAGLVVLGFNASVLIHAAEIVKAEKAVVAWRTFITGKSILTIYVLVDLWTHHHHPHGWALALVGVALILTLISLVLLNRARLVAIEDAENLSHLTERNRP